MSQLHQLIISSEKTGLVYAPQAPIRIGEGLLNPSFINTTDCEALRASQPGLTASDKVRSQHSSDYSQENMGQLPQ